MKKEGIKRECMEVEEYKQEKGCERIMCERERARKGQDIERERAR